MRKENFYLRQTMMPSRNANANYDHEMSMLLEKTNHFVAEHVQAEYGLAIHKFDTFQFDQLPDSSVVVVKGKVKAHHVDVTTWTCSCSFSMSMKLPCRHVIAVRRYQDKTPWIPVNDLNAR